LDVQAKLTIKAKTGFKVNEQYSHKIKLAPAPDGLEYPNMTVKEGGRLEDKQTFTLPVPFKARRAGTYTLTGTAHFSVCNETQCLIEKREISATVTVK
jgi:hypothetical protein